MFKDIFQFYKLGKQLGLHKKEINNILLFEDKKHPTLYLVLFILTLVAIGVIVVVSIGIISFSRINTYPAGTLYSTVKDKDFKRIKWKIQFWQ